MANLLTAVWGPRFSTFRAQRLNQKFADFFVACSSAHAAMSKLAHQMGMNDAMMLFVAPEYYFIKDQTFGLLTETEKNALESALHSLSVSLARMVIVPGTVNYRKEPKWYQKKSLYRGRAARTYSAHSYCPIYSSGKSLLKYYKRMNDSTYDNNHPEHDAYFSPGSKTATFKRNGLRFGLDVCGDFTENRLVGDVPSRDLDVHVYSSGTNLHDFSDPNKIAARNGGYFVHCDCNDDPFSHQNRNGVWAVKRGGGLHSGPQGETVKQLTSSATLNHSRWGDVPMETRFKTKLRAAVAQGGTPGNVTRQSPLRVPIHVTGLQIFNCPL